MSRFPVAVPRGNRLPPVGQSGAVNVLCIGDVHFDSTTLTGGAWPYSARLSKAADDISTMTGRGQLDAVVQLGDNTTDALDNEYAAYLAWKASISLPTGVQFREIPGNHDLTGMNANGTADIVTTAQWATKMGLAAKDNYLDIGNVRLLLMSPTADATGAQTSLTRLFLDATDIAWLDARMSETTRKCVVFFHAPLWHTAGPLDGSAFSTYDATDRWISQPRAGIEAMIARHSNLVAWVSGHTHARTSEVATVKAMTYGSVTIAAISASSPSLLNPDAGVRFNQIATALVTVYPTRVEVRYRDHGAGQWLSPVYTVTF